MGSRIWVENEVDGIYMCSKEIRVLSFKQFCPADPPGPGQRRKKHLVQLWSDPGGLRTLSVGSIRMKDPRKVAAGYAAAETRRENEEQAAEDDYVKHWPLKNED